MYGLVERGVQRRPEIALGLSGRVVFRFEEDFAPVRIAFNAHSVLVEDGDVKQPDLVIAGCLPDIVHLATAPLWRGIPSLRRRKGLGALARVALGRVHVRGDRKLARGVLSLLALEDAAQG
jgi:hypothetical protein